MKSLEFENWHSWIVKPCHHTQKKTKHMEASFIPWMLTLLKPRGASDNPSASSLKSDDMSRALLCSFWCADKGTWYLAIMWRSEEYKRDGWLSELLDSPISRTAHRPQQKTRKERKKQHLIFQIPTERLTHCFYLVIRRTYRYLFVTRWWGKLYIDRLSASSVQ